MPYCVTMPRAMSVQRSMSSDAPVVISPNTSSSAVRPPSSIAIESSSSLRVRRYLSSVGRASVQPRARPRATIETLWIGSVPSQHVADERVAALVVGDRELLLLAHDPVLALRPGHHAVDGGLELGVADELQVAAGGEQRGLVHEVGEVGAGEARACAGRGRRGGRWARAACPWRAPRGWPCGPRGRGGRRRSGGRSDRGAAGRGRGCRAGWRRR